MNPFFGDVQEIFILLLDVKKIIYHDRFLANFTMIKMLYTKHAKMFITHGELIISIFGINFHYHVDRNKHTLLHMLYK